jgi:hypothetical protein
MKLPFGIATLSLALVGISPHNALAFPIEGKAKVMGVPAFSLAGEVELGLTDMPFKLGAQASTVFGSYGLQSGWGSYTYRLSATSAVGVVAGLNLDWTRRMAPAPPADPNLYPGRVGYLFGAFYEHSRGNVSMRLTPNVSLVPSDPLPPPPDQPERGYLYRFPEINLARTFLAGLPWLEVGYEINPNLELSLRTSLTPLAVTCMF